MKKLAQLHEEFIQAAHRPMTFGKLPVTPSRAELPIVPVNKWQKIGPEGRLHKRFIFQNHAMRNEFITSLLEQEDETEHRGILRIEDDHVDITIFTRNVDVVTELDKEYARAADEIFRDVVYGSSDQAKQKQ